MVKNLRKPILFIIPIFIFLLVWEGISRAELVNPRLFPPPSIVWKALCEWINSGELWLDIKASIGRMVIGLCLGGGLGILIGMLTGRIQIVSLAFNPLLQLFRPLPPVAIIPLVIVWLGIGDTAKVFSISFAVFFPVWINVHLAASSIPHVYLWSAKLLCRSNTILWYKVLLPATLPSIIAGLRTSIAIAFIMVYVAEIAGASVGIGYRISVSHLAYRIDKMVAALIVLAVAGALTDLAFYKAMLYIFPWIRNNQPS